MKSVAEHVLCVYYYTYIYCNYMHEDAIWQWIQIHCRTNIGDIAQHLSATKKSEIRYLMDMLEKVSEVLVIYLFPIEMAK